MSLKVGDVVVGETVSAAIATAMRTNRNPSCFVGFVNGTGGVITFNGLVTVWQLADKSWNPLPDEWHEELLHPFLIQDAARQGIKLNSPMVK